MLYYLLEAGMFGGFFNFIFWIFIIWFLIRQSHRISHLEKLVQGKVFTTEIKKEVSQSTEAPGILDMTVEKPKIASNISTPKIEMPAEDQSGKILGRIGISAVLLGVAFFLNYAFQNNWIGPSGRVMIGILFGVGFLVTGQILRNKYLQYSDLLMGGGIAVLYLSVFSAQAFYHLIDPFTTGIFMMMVTAVAFVLSIVNATMTLALVGVAGGFATPFLSGSQGNSMVMLFSYITLLNVCVLGISFFKKWPQLIGVALVGTGINFLAWGFSYYTPDYLTVTMFFLFISFMIFLIASIARGVTAGLQSTRDDQFLIAMDAVGFAFTSYILLQPEHHNLLAFGAVFISLIYMVFAYLVNKFNPTDKVLNIFLPGLAVTFLSIAVPLQLSGQWIAVAWLVESLMLYYIASMISNRGFQVMGATVYVLGLVNFFFWNGSVMYRDLINFVPVFNMSFMILVLAVLISYLIAYMYVKYGSITAEIRDKGIMVFVIMANVLTIFAFTTQITNYHQNKILIFQKEQSAIMQENYKYNNDYSLNYQTNNNYYQTISSINNQSNTLVSVSWALYAALLTAIGFAKRFASIRRLGLALFIITGIKVLLDVWSLGQLYRVISFIVFGIIALIASFGYAKYKDRLKAIIVLFLILISGLSFGSAKAEFNINDWQYMRTVFVSGNSDFTKIVLPQDISKSSNDFHDIRIINQNGIETPYLITRSISTKNAVTDVGIVNQTTLNGMTQFIADTKQDGLVRTRLALYTSNNNFKRQVSIYSSHNLLPINSPNWALVTNTGYVFKFTDAVTGFTSGKNDVSFNANTARYFKVVIGEGVEGPVNVMTAEMYGDTSVSAPTYTKNVSTSVANNQGKRSTEVTLDLGASGYITNSVTLKSLSRNYSRRVLVESSNDKNSWSYVGDGYISNISTPLFTGSANTISYPEQKSRYIRLSILNDDNSPINIEGKAEVSGPVISAIFETQPNSVYIMYYGNPSARNPVYDIARISSYIEENNIPVASYAGEVLNPAYKAPLAPVIPYTESHKWPLNLVLVFVVLLMAVGIGFYLMTLHKKDSGSVERKGFENRE